MSTTTRETTIEALTDLPVIRTVREFDAPPEAVFRAHTDPTLVTQWLGPRNLSMTIDRWDAESGGGYRYTHRDENGEYSFYGSFHEVRPNERIVQTFTYVDWPDAVILETMTFEDLGGRTRLVSYSTSESFESRDAMVASGMEVGIKEGFEQLDELLARS